MLAQRCIRGAPSCRGHPNGDRGYMRAECNAAARQQGMDAACGWPLASAQAVAATLPDAAAGAIASILSAKRRGGRRAAVA